MVLEHEVFKQAFLLGQHRLRLCRDTSNALLVGASAFPDRKPILGQAQNHGAGLLIIHSPTRRLESADLANLSVLDMHSAEVLERYSGRLPVVGGLGCVYGFCSTSRELVLVKLWFLVHCSSLTPSNRLDKSLQLLA